MIELLLGSPFKVVRLRAADTPCHTHGTYQIGITASTSCFTNRHVFSDEQ